jgi:WD40 repeat protein
MLASRTFRIFVSSTFSDLKEERNALQKYVFPRLRELCMQHGCRFQAIDLRWGVSEEASRDQQTVKICLEEIKRCQRVTPRPNFIVLLGDRHGWRPLPAEIAADEFEEILRHVTNPDESALLVWGNRWLDQSRGWYRRDDNAVPAVYCLQPRTGDFEVYARWQPVEQRLHLTLLQATAEIALPPSEQVKYTASAPEQEIVRGALNVDDANEHVFCFFRKITNLDDLTNDLSRSEVAASFIDVDRSMRPDHEALTLQRDLKQRLRDSLPHNIHEYQAEWRSDGITTDHIGKLPETLDDCLKLIEDDHRPSNLCVDIWRRLARVILDEIARLEKIEALEKEIRDHGSFGEERARLFIGRASILKTILDYVAREDGHPLAVWGESGSGKSALMGKAISDCGSHVADAAIVSRFIGATPASSDARSLLESICRQVTRIYGRDEATIPTDYKELVKELPQRLALAKSDKPLVVFLDALDQLSDADHARNLIFPRELPEHVQLVVSTLPGECKSALERKLPSTNLVKLEPMPSEEGSELLEVWLKEAGRTLQLPQRDEVLRKFAASGRPAEVSSDIREEGGMPLYLKLAFEEARRWKSYSPPVDLAGDIPGIIRQLFERLSLDANHGKVMVERSLGYLAAAKNGLTEDELLDVLSRDERVIGEFRRRSPKSPDVDNLPVVVWSRLQLDLEPYLTERPADGISLLAFYHRALRDTATQSYLAGDHETSRHRALASYFDEQPLETKHGGKRASNLRKLSELPYQEIRTKSWVVLERLLTDLSFADAKVRNLGVHSLVDDCIEAEENGYEGRVLKLLAGALQLSSHVLAEDPDQLAGQLIARLDRSAPELIAQILRQTRRRRTPWLRPTYGTLTSPGGPLVKRFVGHNDWVDSVAFTPDGEHLLSSSSDGTISLWTLRTGERQVLEGHRRRVYSCIPTPDGRRAVSASFDGTIKVSDLDTGREVMTLRGHTDAVYALSLTAVESCLISSSVDCTLRVLDMDSGRPLYVLESNSDRQNPGSVHYIGGIALVPGTPYLISRSNSAVRLWNLRREERVLAEGDYESISVAPDGRSFLAAQSREVGLGRYGIEVRDAATGNLRKMIDAHSRRILSLTVLPDGRRAISGSMDGTVRLWDLESGSLVRTLEGHDGTVLDTAIDSRGRYASSCAMDYTVILWDLEALPPARSPQHLGEVVTAMLEPGGKGAVTASPFDLKAWIVSNASERHSYRLTWELLVHRGLGLSPDGLRAGFALKEQVLGISSAFSWNLEDGTVSRYVGEMEREDHILAGLLLPNRRHAVLAYAITPLAIWDLESGEKFRDLEGHDGSVNDVTAYPDGRRILSASADGTVRIWDAAQGTSLKVLSTGGTGVLRVAISDDSSHVVAASSGKTLICWNATSGEIRYERLVNDAPVALAILRNEYVALACRDQKIRIFELLTGRRAATLGHGGEINCLRAVGRSPMLLSSSNDRTLRLWNAISGSLLSTFTIESEATQFAVDDESGSICLGDRLGNVHFLRIEEPQLSP